MHETETAEGKRKSSKTPDFEIGGKKVAPGTRKIVDIPISLLSNHTPVNLARFWLCPWSMRSGF